MSEFGPITEQELDAARDPRATWPMPRINDGMVDRACRVVAAAAGEHFDTLDDFTKSVLRDTQRAALEAAMNGANV